MFYIPYSICMFVKLRVSKRLLYAQQSLRQTGKQYVLYDLCAVHSPEGNDALSALSVNGQGSPSSSTSLHSDLTLVYHQVSPPSLLADLVDWPIQLIVDKQRQVFSWSFCMSSVKKWQFLGAAFQNANWSCDEWHCTNVDKVYYHNMLWSSCYDIIIWYDMIWYDHHAMIS